MEYMGTLLSLCNFSMRLKVFKKKIENVSLMDGISLASQPNLTGEPQALVRDPVWKSQMDGWLLSDEQGD